MAIINDNLDELLKMPGRLEQFGTKCRRSHTLMSAHPHPHSAPQPHPHLVAAISAKYKRVTSLVSGRVVPIVVLSGVFLTKTWVKMNFWTEIGTSAHSVNLAAAQLCSPGDLT